MGVLYVRTVESWNVLTLKTRKRKRSALENVQTFEHSNVPTPSRLAVLHLGEDHAARYRLQYSGDDDFYVAVHVLLAVLDYYHRAVVQIRDPLAQLFALLDDVDIHLLAGQHHGLDRVGKLVYVEHLHALYLGH